MKSHVLIVEDRAVIANNLSDRLEALGYVVLGIATSGMEGVELAAKTRPDLVLMDIRLPGGMDGIEAAKRIRQQWDVPVVYLTGHADRATVQRAKVTEPFGYLLKPFDPRELRTTIEMALYKHAMEKRLGESEKKYRHLVEQSLQGIVIIGSRAPWILFANGRCAEISGYDLREMLALEPDRLEALIHPEDRGFLLTQLNQALAGQPFSPTGEFRFVRVTGDVRWVEYHASPIEHEGQPALQAAMVDITERKEAERALLEAHSELERRVKARTADLARANSQLRQEVAERKQAQAAARQHAAGLQKEVTVRRHTENALRRRNRELALLSAVVQQTAEAVLIIGKDNRIVYVNSAFERLTGFSSAKALGETPGLLRSDWHEEEYYSTLRETIGSGRIWQGRLINKHKDGTLFPVDATITPLRNSDGRIENTVATLRDVAREVQLEEQVRHAQKMEALGHLAGSIAHDFNNMLSVICMASTMLARHMAPGDPLFTYTDQIQQTITRATCLTRQLLTFSRREDTRFKATDLSQIVDGLSWMLRRLAGSRCQLVKVLDEHLLPVRANPSSMEQVIMNLVVNARDAMPEGGSLIIETANKTFDEACTAEHKDIRPGPYVMLKVSDTGTGMDDTVRSRIFEPFFTTKRRGEGTGLGLSTVQQIVQRAGGYIHVDTRLGQGTSFQILLPSQERNGLPPQRGPQPELKKTLSGETILIVEDDPIIRALAARQLGSYGYQVHVAGSGPEALELCGQIEQDIHLSLVDVMLPSMNGLELVQQLQLRQPEMRVVYMSGYGEDVALVRTALEGETAFLRKPFDLHTLTAKVQKVLADDEGAVSSRNVDPGRSPQ